MMNYLHHPLPGPGYGAICEALGAPPDSTVSVVLAEIARLKMAAAEGPQPAKPARPLKSMKSMKSFKDIKDPDDDKELA
jgi:hypothetical protein